MPKFETMHVYRSVYVPLICFPHSVRHQEKRMQCEKRKKRTVFSFSHCNRYYEKRKTVRFIVCIVCIVFRFSFPLRAPLYSVDVRPIPCNVSLFHIYSLPLAQIVWRLKFLSSVGLLLLLAPYNTVI